MKRPPPVQGLRHLALKVPSECFNRSLDFYVRLVGMAIEWQPDEDNVYLCSGCDNLALHRCEPEQAAGNGALDHIGFILGCGEDVDRWHEFLVTAEVPIVHPPRSHRDGARSFYCRDPAGVTVQFIFHPPLAPAAATGASS